MNILMTIYFPYNVGGAEASTYFLAKELNRLGHKVIIASTEKYPEMKTYVFRKYKKIPFFWFHRFYLSRFLSNIIKKEKINLIHSHDRLTSIGGIISAKKNKIPVVVHFRDYWFLCPKSTLLDSNYRQCSMCSYRKLLACNSKKRILWDMYKWHEIKHSWNMLKRADFKIAISNSIKKKLKSIGIEDARVIPNPIDLGLFSKSNGGGIRKKYGLKGIVITFIGSVSYHKGGGTLMRIIPEILKENKNVNFLIAGEGDIKEEFMDFVRNNKIEKNVIFTGKLPYDKIPDVYAASDIILFPSIWEEPFGRIAVESMASGKPIIASNTGGIPDILEDGKTGYLVDPSDMEKWKELTIKLIKDKNLRNRLGKNGLKLVKERYSVPLIANKVINIYNGILKKGD